jgi:WD40 repeat protein
VVAALTFLLSVPGALGAGSGRYTPVPGSPFALRRDVGRILLSPNGRLLAVTSYLPQSGYRTAPMILSVSASGQLTELPGTPASIDGLQYAFQSFSADGKLIMASTEHALWLFAVGPDGVTGPVVSWRVPVRGLNYFGANFSPHGRTIAVAVNTLSPHHGSATELDMLSVGARNAIHRLPGPPVFFGSPHGQAVALTYSPSGRRLALADSAGQLVSVYAVRADGSVAADPLSTVITPEQPNDVEFSPSGRLLAVTYDGPAEVSMFTVAATGALRPVAGSPFPFQTGSSASVSAFDHTGRRLVVTSSDAMFDPLFAVSADGALRPVQRLRVAERAAPGRSASNDAQFSANGRLLAIGDWADGKVWMFSRP